MKRLASSVNRSPTWMHSDGSQASVEALAEAFIGNTSNILSLQADIYASSDMKQGINEEELLMNQKLLAAIVRLDPRGGIFKQALVEDALESRLHDDGVRDRLVRTTGDQLKFIAYKVRVMCSHIRIIYDTCKSGHDNHSLAAIFSVMSSAGPTYGEQRKRRTDARLGIRQCPFVNFRVEEEPQEDHDEGEDALMCVSKWYDPVHAHCKMLLSDGTVQLADKYEAGPEGFVTALWYAPAEDLTTEVANLFLQPSGIITKSTPARATPTPTARTCKGKGVITRRPRVPIVVSSSVTKKPAGKDATKITRMLPRTVVAPSVMKRPAGEDEADEAEDEESDGAQDAPAAEAATHHGEPMEDVSVQSKCKPGHNGSHTIQARRQSNRKDKAQIFSAPHRDVGLSSREICESIAEYLASWMAEDDIVVAGELKSNSEFLKQVRDVAREFRDSVMAAKSA